MFMNKKGVSPIIAAVLLVVITIAIGATTMAFIRSLSDQNLASAQEKSEKIACGTDVTIEVLAINNKYKICHQNTNSSTTDWFGATIKNKGSKDVKYFRLTALGDGSPGFTTKEISAALSGVTTDNYVNINTTFNGNDTGTVLEYLLEPVIQGAPGKDIICADSAIKWDASQLTGTC